MNRMATYRLLHHFSKSAPSFRNSIATTHSRTTRSDYYSIRRFVSSSPEKEYWIALQKQIEDLKKGYMELKKSEKSTKDWILQVEVDGWAACGEICNLKVLAMCNHDTNKDFDSRITKLEEAVFPKGVIAIAKVLVRKSVTKGLITGLIAIGGYLLQLYGLWDPLQGCFEEPFLKSAENSQNYWSNC